MRILGLMLAASIAASASQEPRIRLGDVAENAMRESTLTLVGSKPFHLKAEIVETTNPSSEYQAKIDEYWVSTQKWRRTIGTPEFSQILIVNGDEVSEKDTGNYFPWWLKRPSHRDGDPTPDD